MDTQRFVTVRELADAPGWPTESALRALIFNANSNGLARRFVGSDDACWLTTKPSGSG